MQAFVDLTYAGQAGRLRRFGQTALIDFGVGDAHLKLLAHSQNTTFRVTLPNQRAESAPAGPYLANQFLLRVHGADRHGPQLDSRAAIAAELAWLAALRRDTQLAVPEPMPTTDGGFTTLVHAVELPQPRVCSLLRWLDGKRYWRRWSSIQWRLR
jgi:Ser/Thr protein kinase RdoA (MazF antagonist)